MRLRTIAAALVVGLFVAACSPSIVALDTKPIDEGSARNLAFSVAEKANCGSFESLASHSDKSYWTFSCERDAVAYDIWTFGSDNAKQTGTAELQVRNAVFLVRNYFAVEVVPTGPSKSEASQAQPSASLLDPFK
jgi:hypothetical protein